MPRAVHNKQFPFETLIRDRKHLLNVGDNDSEFQHLDTIS